MVEAEHIDKAPDILALTSDRIVGVGCPVAVAMAALIERNAVELVAQCEAAQIPGMRRQSAAMQKKKRRQPLVSPIEVAEPELINEYGFLARQDDFVEAEAGANRGRLEMFV